MTLHTKEENIEKIRAVLDSVKHVNSLSSTMSKRSLEVELECLQDLANQGHKALSELLEIYDESQ